MTERNKIRIVQLLQEQGYTPDITHDEKGWVVTFYDNRGNRYEVKPTTLVADLWWLDKRYSVIDPFDTLEEWLKQLNRIFQVHYGIGYDHFEDYDWAAEFESKNSPKEAFEEWRLLNDSTTLGG